MSYRCENRCHFFDECCADAPQTAAKVSQLNYSCVEYIENEASIGYAVVSDCPGAADEMYARLCKQGIINSWSPLAWPVDNSLTQIRYLL